MTGTERDLFEEFGERALYIRVDEVDGISKSALQIRKQVLLIPTFRKILQ